jgi:hypothetical protein
MLPVASRPTVPCCPAVSAITASCFESYWATFGNGPWHGAAQRATTNPAEPSTRMRKSVDMSDAEVALGKLAQRTGEEIMKYGWRAVVRRLRGTSNTTPNVDKIPHKAARLLDHLRRHGASVPLSTVPWDVERLDEAVRRGPHQSSHGERTFVAREMLDFCQQQGYWMVVPFDVVRTLLPTLRVSPLGVVPQRDRRPRLIVDYTFSGVNEETVALAPREAMQFGRALQRVISGIVRADPRYRPVSMAKIDIADGFYRVWLQPDDIAKLGVALPTPPGCLYTFGSLSPSSTHGVDRIPPYFTALSETACNIANARLLQGDPQLNRRHRLEAVASTPPPDVASRCLPATKHRATGSKVNLRRPPLASVDVYVDDFLLLAQTKSQQQRVMRAALTSIDDVFRPLHADDPSFRKEPASVKKMLQGEAHWAVHKRMLGWDIDSASMTLNLPPHHVARLREVLQWLQPSRKRLAIAKWHQLLGELRSMSPALPGTRGLFSVLQHALSSGDRRRVRLSQQVYDTAADFNALVDSLAQRPTRLQELVPMEPSHIGASDACQVGMGGIWMAPTVEPPYSGASGSHPA